MPQLSTLKHVADIVVSRILANAADHEDVAAALEEAYPFGDHPHGKQVWLDALLRHAYGADNNRAEKPELLNAPGEE
jgi:hypothetical protein